MRRFRSLLIVLYALAGLLAVVPGARAAVNPLAELTGKPAAKPPAAPPAPAALTPAQLNAAIATLNNPAERTALIATLEAMKSPAIAGTATPAPGLGLGLLQRVEVNTRRILGEIGGALSEATDVRLVWHWLVFVATDAWLRQTVIHAAGWLASVLATALAGESLAIYGLRGPRRNVLKRAARLRSADVAQEAGLAAAEAGESEQRPRRRSLRRWFARLPYALGHFALSLLPVLVFALIGFIWLSGGLADARVARLVTIAVLTAYIACRLVLEVARFLLAPQARDIRLIRTTDRRAAWLVTWLRRIIVVIAFGYAAITTGGLFGLYAAASAVLIKLLSLIVHVMAAIMVLQARKPAAAIIRGDRHGAIAQGGVLGAMRAGLARSWHILALFYIVALWVAWAIGVPNAFVIMLRIVVVFAVVAAAARSLSAWLAHGLEAAFDDGVPWRADYPGLHARARLYLPVFKMAISAILGAIAILVILQLWGVGVLDWFAATAIGQRIVSAAVTIGLAALIGLGGTCAMP